MHKNYLLFLLLLIFSSFLFAQSEEEIVKTSFETYKTTLKERNGEQALLYLDSAGLKYYETILAQVKYLKKEDFANIPIVNKPTILTIRYIFTKEEILSMDSKKLYKYLVNNGLVGENIYKLSAGEVVMQGNRAEMKPLYFGRVAPLVLYFNKESNIWKMDILEVLELGTPILTQMLAEGMEDNEMTENEFWGEAARMTGTLKGKEQQNDIWQPIGDK